MRNIKEYLKPATIEEAVILVRQHPGDGKYIAGGARIAVEKDPSLDYLVDITSCGLNYIREESGQLRIGACATLEELNRSELIGGFASGILKDVARWTGSRQLRNSTTVGGSIISISDIALPLLALDAEIAIVGDAERTISLSEFYENKGGILHEGELIKECILPEEFRDATGSALRMSRTHQDVSIVGVAAVMIKENARCKKARITVEPVTRGITRIPKAEVLLEGQVLTDELIEEAAETAAQEIQTIDDFRASAEYRRKMITVYTKRALTLIK